MSFLSLITILSAQTPTEEVSLETALMKIFIQLLLASTPFFIALLGLLMKRTTDWIATKVKNEKAQGIITRLDDVILRALQSTSAVFVAEIKKNSSSPLTEQQKMQAMQKTLEAIELFIDKKMEKELNYLFGKDKARQRKLLEVRTEALLLKEKQQSAPLS